MKKFYCYICNKILTEKEVVWSTHYICKYCRNIVFTYNEENSRRILRTLEDEVRSLLKYKKESEVVEFLTRYKGYSVAEVRAALNKVKPTRKYGQVFSASKPAH